MSADRWRDAVHNNVLYDLWSRDMRSGTDLGDRGHWQRVLQQMTGWPQALVSSKWTGSALDGAFSRSRSSTQSPGFARSMARPDVTT